MKYVPARYHLLLGQMLRFALSTILSASVTLLLPILLHEVFRVPQRQAVSIGFTTAFLVGFVVVRKFVFRRSTQPAADFLKYGTINLGFRLCEYLTFNLIFSRLRLNYIIAVLIVLSISSTIKFFSYRLWMAPVTSKGDPA